MKNTAYRYAKFSACFFEPINCTMAKNCWWPSYFSCFSSTSIKWFPKQDCIITQSTAPGRFISVAKNTISSPAKCASYKGQPGLYSTINLPQDNSKNIIPCSVVTDLWQCTKWCITCSREPCHLHVAPGHGQLYGLKFKNKYTFLKLLGFKMIKNKSTLGVIIHKTNCFTKTQICK